MSAHCDHCGYDLPYDGDCRYCEIGRALEQIHSWAHHAGWRRIEATAASGLRFGGKYRWLRDDELDGPTPTAPTEGGPPTAPRTPGQAGDLRPADLPESSHEPTDYYGRPLTEQERRNAGLSPTETSEP